jgi:beta-phosphoglucomutase-like phosphatase (HAD superfamily)
LVTADDIKHGKPDPEPYLKGAQFLGVSAADCIVFEDAPAGIRAGKAAGARVVALRTTSSDAELQQAGADWIVDNCAELFLDSPQGVDELVLLIRQQNRLGFGING